MEQGGERGGNGNQGNPPSREREERIPLFSLSKSHRQTKVVSVVQSTEPLASPHSLSSSSTLMATAKAEASRKKGDGGWRGGGGGGERGLLLSGPPPPPLSILSFSGGRAPPSPLFLILSGKQLLLERERENQGGGESGVFLGFPPEYLVRRQKVRTGGGRSTSFKEAQRSKITRGEKKKHRVEVRKRTPPPLHFLFPPTF